MIVEILDTDLRRYTMGTGIVAPTENACFWNIQWEKVAEPVDIVHCPGLLTVSI